ncbi:MAG: hypothetical protein K0Q49_1072 [Haloplasmataceae bacterium]|nr:hypothetical protein [Haloplasmataceae bacterium]
MIKKWDVTVEEKSYEVKIKFNALLGTHYLTVNGERINYKPTCMRKLQELMYQYC